MGWSHPIPHRKHPMIPYFEKQGASLTITISKRLFSQETIGDSGMRFVLCKFYACAVSWTPNAVVVNCEFYVPSESKE
jgi:hypothetical protein